MVKTWCSSLALNSCGDIVAIASFRKAVGLPKNVGPGGWHDKMILNGDKLVDLSPWVLYVCINNCKSTSQSF